jgi:hypothetical protein
MNERDGLGPGVVALLVIFVLVVLSMTPVFLVAMFFGGNQ